MLLQLALKFKNLQIRNQEVEMTKFNGVILNEIRDACGYTRKELADKLEISEQSVWQFERGFVNPGYDTLNKLDDVFMVQRSFFLLPDDQVANEGFESVVDEKRVACRSNVKSKTKKIAREQAYLNVVHHMIKEMLLGIAPMDNKLLSLRQDVRDLQLEGADINRVGVFVRRELGISDDNRNLIPVLERAGAYIVERGMAQDVDAYSTWTDDEMPIIVLDSTKQVAVRRNMDAAHEAGHIFLHFGWDLSDDSSTEYALAEKQANEFAAALTLPYDTFPTVFSKLVSDPTNPMDYIEIKKFYNISMQAICYRALKLGLITKQQSGYFWGRLKKNKLDVIEPLDKEIRLVAPGKIRAILKVRTENGLARITDLLSVEHNFLTILGLDKMFIKSLKLETKRTYPNNIIDLFGKPNLDQKNNPVLFILLEVAPTGMRILVGVFY